LPANFSTWRESLSPEAAAELKIVEDMKPPIQDWLRTLNLARVQKNLATLWVLNEVFANSKNCLSDKLSSIKMTLDAGTQDFARLPALAFFLQQSCAQTKILGLELDAFPVLRNGHSRADVANYIAGLVGNAKYSSGDFFHWQEPVDFITAFYPFVSPHPALAWGLPAHYGDARPWVKSIAKNLRPGGLALVVHQGAWEEEEFDSALPYADPKLCLLTRLELKCSFYPLPHPMRASLYSGSFHPDPVSL
jgi:hypothetical protein